MSGESEGEFATEGYSTAESESVQEGEIDIPFLMPEEFREVTSMTPYSLEEELWKLSDKIMTQSQRHYIIHRPGQRTVAAVTPWVKPAYVTGERLVAYLEERIAGFLSGGEVDTAIEAMHQKLLENASSNVSSTKVKTPKTPKVSPKTRPA